MNIPALVLIVFFIITFPAIYLAGNGDYQDYFINLVFAQSEQKNKTFENVTLGHSSETGKGNVKSFQANPVDTTSLTQDTATNSTGNNIDKIPAKKLRESSNPKIQAAIERIFENASPRAIAQQYGATLDKDSLVVYVHLKDHSNKPQNLEVLAQDKNIIKSKLNLNQIKSLANSNAIEKITLPEFAEFYGNLTSEGVEFSGADTYHAAGINGTGIKIGVIDDSFIISNQEISDNWVSLWNGTVCADISCNFTDGNSHGTAVASIVVDMAPESELYLYAIDDSLDFAGAVQHAIDNDVDILTASLGFPDLWGDVWYRDGTSSVAQWVDWAYGNGTLFTVAAGNQGNIHWSGDYNSTTKILTSDLDDVSPGAPTEFKFDMQTSGINSVLNFNSSATGNMRACLPVIDNNGKYLARWNDTLPSDQDYDFFFYDSTLNDRRNSGVAPQDGSPTHIPKEEFSEISGEPGCLVVGSVNSTENHKFHIQVGSDGINNELDIPDDDPHRLGSIDTPADSFSSLAVGAINFNSSPTNYSDDTLESFSSKGPTDDGRLKPEICGPDRTITDQTVLTSGSSMFAGTSAAAPHIAGAAALLLENDPSLTASELKQKLIDDARFDADFSVDNECGSNSGSLQLPILNSTITITKVANGGNEVFDFTTATTDENLDGNFTGNGGFTINTSSDNSVTFTGLSPDLNYTISESVESGWEFNTLSCTGGSNTPEISGATVTVDPNSGEQIDCTFTNSIIPACTPPGSGDWTITESCMLSSNHSVNGGDVIVQGNSVLTIPNGVILGIELTTHNLTVEFGSGVLIKSGGAINTIHPDSDSDGIPDSSDNCPDTPNAGQLDTDMDSTGDACDTDDDNDTILDVSDNCPLIANANQNDLDSDGTGDACDSNTVITSDTTLMVDTILDGDLVVESGFVLTINPGVTLDIDLVNQKILVKSSGGILIKSGGTIN